MKYIINLDKDCEEGVEAIGGKARNLAELCKIDGIRVPRAICVKSLGFDEFTKSICLPAFIYKIEDIKDTSTEIKKAVRRQPIPNAITKEIVKEIANLREPFAVRSSAALEDSSKYSFAGQQDSFLNVARKDVADAVRDCWASLYNARALSYRARIGINEIGSMGVVVQELVLARKSGVIATLHPVTKNKDVIFVNANWGFGETVVSGEVNPDGYYIRKSDGVVVAKKINKKDVMSCIEQGTLIRKDISHEAISEEACLSDEELLELYDSAMRIEGHYKSPQDIEFAIDSAVNIVQARPLK